jgi:acetyl esterase/lipase
MRKILFIVSLILASTAPYSNNFAQETSVTYETESDILYYSSDSTELDDYMKARCRLDLYFPVNVSDFPTVIWFHGGGLRGGNRNIPEQLKNKNMAIAAVNYRLYPKVSCPVYIEDAAAAVGWIFKNIHKYGGNPDVIFVSAKLNCSHSIRVRRGGVPRQRPERGRTL